MRFGLIALLAACAGDEKIDDSSTSEEIAEDTAEDTSVEDIEDTGDAPVGPQGEIVDDECLDGQYTDCLLYTSPSPRDLSTSRMPSSA